MKEEPSTAATGKDAESVILEGSSGGIITENRLSIKVNGAPVRVADKRAGAAAYHAIVQFLHGIISFVIFCFYAPMSSSMTYISSFS